MSKEPDLQKVITDMPWSAIVVPLVLGLIVAAAFVVIVLAEK